MKDKIQNQQSIHRFTRSQIAQGDVREFLTKYDPPRLDNSQVAKLFGAISFKFEGIEEVEVHTNGELRILLRRLHAIWPWSGFFLNLKESLGPGMGLNKTPLLALAMCVADRTSGEDQVLNVVKPQLRRFQFRSHEIIDRLAKRAGIQARTIKARHSAVDKQFKSKLNNL